MKRIIIFLICIAALFVIFTLSVHAQTVDITLTGGYNNGEIKNISSQFYITDTLNTMEISVSASPGTMDLPHLVVNP